MGWRDEGLVCESCRIDFAEVSVEEQVGASKSEEEADGRVFRFGRAGEEGGRSRRVESLKRTW